MAFLQDVSFWDGMGSHDSGEEFGQPGVSFGAQVLQEFHADVVVTWGCRWFRLLQLKSLQ